ncbi:MAG: ABC transporter permease, partial [Thermomicrobiales bacterium]
MARYLARRLVQTIPLLFLISIMGFVIIQATGDPLAAYTMETALSREDIARLRAYYGLDLRIYVQFLFCLGNLERGDGGCSYVGLRPV